jgi:hypothetical protein
MTKVFGAAASEKRSGALSVARYFEALSSGTTLEPASVQVANSEASGVAASVTITFTSTGPVAAQSGSIGGKTLLAKASGAVAANGEFDTGSSAGATAASFVLAVNAFIPQLVATRVSGVVTVAAREKGVLGNLITALVGTLANTTFSATALAGGVDVVYTTWDLT